MNIVDVKADGHCGYRSIAGLLGMGEDGWEIPYVPRIEAFRSSLGTNSNVATQEAIDLDET